MPWRKQFETNEEYNEWYRTYRLLRGEKFRAYQREYNKLWRKKNGYHNEEKWRASHPIALNAEKILRYAVKKGIIKKSPCFICGKEKSVAHHPDYSRPLKITFLCHKHHRKFHYGFNKEVPDRLL